MEQLKKLNEKAENYLSRQYPSLNVLERRYGISKVYFAGTIVGLSTFALGFNIGGGVLSNLIGYTYPAFLTLKYFAFIESKETEPASSVANPPFSTAVAKNLLTYWLIFATFTLTESFFGTFLGYIPFYFLLKSASLVYLFSSQYNGVAFIYERLVSLALCSRSSLFEKDSISGLDFGQKNLFLKTTLLDAKKAMDGSSGEKSKFESMKTTSQSIFSKTDAGSKQETPMPFPANDSFERLAAEIRKP